LSRIALALAIASSVACQPPEAPSTARRPEPQPPSTQPTPNRACYEAAARLGVELACPAQGGPAWVELTSPHFRLRTDLPSACARAELVEYERAYVALEDLAFPYQPSPPDRVNIVLFARRKDQRRVSPDPLFSGWFMRGSSPWQDGPTLVLRWRDGGGSRRSFLHEMTHRFVRFYFGQVPTWMNEGLAEFYQSLQVSGDVAEMGASPRERSVAPTRWEISGAGDFGDGSPDHGRRIIVYADALPSIDAFDRMTGDFYGPRALPVDARDALRTRNYLGAWAIVHFLKTGPPKYQRAFDAYLRLVLAGKAHRSSWDSAFAGIPAGEIESAMKQRLDRPHTHRLRTKYAPPPPPPIAERSMSDAEVHLAWFRVRSGDRAERAVEGEADVEEALRREPDNPEAIFARALLHLKARRLVEAEADARRALELRPEELRYVEGLVHISTAGRSLQDWKLWKKLEPLLERLGDPSATASALNMSARLSIVRRRPDEGLAAAKLAIQKDPACWECYETLAGLLYEKQDFDAALGAMQLAVNLVPEHLASPALLDRLKGYEAARANAARAKAGSPFR